MKIKVVRKPYSEVMSMNRGKHIVPKRPNMFFRTLMRLVSIPDLSATHFKYKDIGMERLGKKEPCLVLMNHSSFIDLEIAATVMYPRPFNIISTTDGFIGKNWLMRQIGCIPTKKFVNDPTLLGDMRYAVEKLKSSVVLFPEAGYSFDGTSTTLPDTLGRCVKYLGVPLVMIKTYGAFSRDPLYNNLQRRKVNVSATREYLLSREEIREKSADEIQQLIEKQFAFDSFAWQRDNNVKIDEPFRADGLNRVLYKCPDCLTEGQMLGEGTTVFCRACGKKHTLDEYGVLHAEDGETRFSHVPDWYRWQRECVRQEIENGDYSVDIPVDVFMGIDTKCLYDVSCGRLTHTVDGFRLTGAEGELDYIQKPLSSYSLNSDFFWYEIGDVIGIGNNRELYYCFPRVKDDVVTKIRLAAEEIYKLVYERKRARRVAAAES